VVQREPRLLKSVLISVSGGALGILVGCLTTAFLKATLAALPLNLTILPVLIPAEASIASAQRPDRRRSCDRVRPADQRRTADSKFPEHASG
jgi:hypothetical protein